MRSRDNLGVKCHETKFVVNLHYINNTSDLYECVARCGVAVCVCETALHCTLIPIVQHVIGCSSQSPFKSPFRPTIVSSFPVKPDADEWEVWVLWTGFREASSVC